MATAIGATCGFVSCWGELHEISATFPLQDGEPAFVNALQEALLRGILQYHLSSRGQHGRGTRAKGRVPYQALRSLVQQERGRRAGEIRLSSLPSTLKGVTQLCQQQIRKSWAKRNSST